MKLNFHPYALFALLCLFTLTQEIAAAPQKSTSKPRTKSTLPPTLETTSQLESVKSYQLSINPSNQALTFTDDAGKSEEPIPLGSHRKTVNVGPHVALVNYGQGADLRPTITISNQNEPATIHSFICLGHSIQLGPRGAITIALSKELRNLEFTSGHIGKVFLDRRLLPPGSSQTALAGVTVAPPPEKIKKAIPVISRERRTAQVEALRKSTQDLEAASIPSEPLPIQSNSEVTTTPGKEAPVENSTHATEPVTITLNPDAIKEEILAYVRQNQAMLQISQGLAQLNESLTKNPKDHNLRLQIPPPAKPRPLPEAKGSTPEYAVKLQSFLQDYISENARLAASIKTLKEQLAPLQEAQPNLDYSLRPEVPEEFRDDSKRASQAFSEQRFDDAAEIYLKMIKKYPRALYPLSNLGVTYFTQGKYNEAEKTLKETLALAPHDAFSYSILGIILYQLQRPDDAWDVLSLALALHPNDAQTRNYLSVVLVRKGLLEAAEREAREAINLNPNYADAHYHLAVLYSTPEKPSQALARRHYLKSLVLGGARDERLEAFVGTPPAGASEPTIETNPQQDSN